MNIFVGVFLISAVTLSTLFGWMLWALGLGVAKIGSGLKDFGKKSCKHSRHPWCHRQFHLQYRRQSAWLPVEKISGSWSWPLFILVLSTWREDARYSMDWCSFCYKECFPGFLFLLVLAKKDTNLVRDAPTWTEWMRVTSENVCPKWRLWELVSGVNFIFQRNFSKLKLTDGTLCKIKGKPFPPNTIK